MQLRFVKVISMSMALIFFVSLFTACSFQSGFRTGSKYSSSKKHMSGSFTRLSDKDIKEIKLNMGDTLTLTYDIKIESGDLKVSLNSPEGSQVITFDNAQKGKKEVNIEESGAYKIIVAGKDAKGSYDLKWEVH
ncbi:MAG: hypothetical protein ACOYWZ_05265 [Bacillota bacterium]